MRNVIHRNTSLIRRTSGRNFEPSKGTVHIWPQGELWMENCFHIIMPFFHFVTTEPRQLKNSTNLKIKFMCSAVPVLHTQRFFFLSPCLPYFPPAYPYQLDERTVHGTLRINKFCLPLPLALKAVSLTAVCLLLL